jgi:hypothetical protein
MVHSGSERLLVVVAIPRAPQLPTCVQPINLPKVLLASFVRHHLRGLGLARRASGRAKSPPQKNYKKKVRV